MPKAMETGKKRMALGQGLDALIPSSEPHTRVESDGDVAQLPMESLVPNAYQPRQVFSEEGLEDLARSITEIGVIQPLIVRSRTDGSYEIVAGERRWRAAKMAGYATIPAIIRDLSDAESLEIALIENLQRENLNPLDTAEAYDILVKRFSYTHEALAKRIGKERSNVTNHLRLLNLPDSVKQDLRKDLLTMGHARALLAVEHLPTQLSLSQKVVRRKLSVRELERIVQNFKKKQQATEEPLAKDPELLDLEKRLSRILATKAVIHKKKNDSGRIEISFHSREELDRLLELLGYTEDFA